MDWLEHHWITGLTVLAAAFFVLTGVGMVITGGDDNEAGVRVFGVVALVAAVALLSGLQGRRSGSLSPKLAYSLIVVAMVLLAGGFWWFVFIPPVIAVVVIYAGVARRGLERELRPGI